MKITKGFSLKPPMNSVQNFGHILWKCLRHSQTNPELCPPHQAMGDGDERVTGIIEDLDIIEVFEFQCPCSPLHAKFQILVFE